MVRFAHYPELTERSLMYLWQRRVIFTDHVAVRIVAQKPTSRCDQVKRIPRWMSKHPVFCTSLKRISDGPLADFKLIIENARKQVQPSS